MIYLINHSLYRQNITVMNLNIYVEPTKENIFCKDIQEVKELLTKYKNVILESENSKYKEGEDLEKWLSECNLETLKIKYNLKKFKFTTIKDKNVAYNFICSEYWDTGSFYYTRPKSSINYDHSVDYNDDYFNQFDDCDFFDPDTVGDIEFARRCYIEERNTKPQFSKQLREDKEFLLNVVKNYRWNGSVYGFSENVLRDKDFYLELVNSVNWNFEMESLKADNPLKSLPEAFHVINSRFWNGSIYGFNNDIYSSTEFITTAVNSENWDGILWSLSEKVCTKEFCLSLLNNKKWDGSLSGINHATEKDFDLCLQIINSDKWDGCPYYLNKKFFESLDNFKLITRNPGWDGRTDYIYKLFDSIEFYKEVVDSPNWDGACYVKGEHKNKDLCMSIVKNPKWRCCDRYFSKSIKSDIDIYREVFKRRSIEEIYYKHLGTYVKDSLELWSIFINKEEWNGSVSWIDKDILKKKEFRELLEKHPKWNGKFE